MNPPSIKKAARYPMLFCIFLIAIHWLSNFYQVSGGIWGVQPRVVQSLPGVFFAPLVHGGFMHLFSNVASLVLLGTTMWFFYPRIAMRSILLIWPFTGLLVWAFGVQSGPHIGASGLVYGLIGVLFFTAAFRRSLRAAVIALAIGSVYISSMEGLFPNKAAEHISWESHLAGFAMGAGCAYLFRKRLEPEEKEALAKAKAEESERKLQARRPKELFLPRDIFDKTLAQREQDAMDAAAAAAAAAAQQNNQNPFWPPFGAINMT
jgi:membrane associated rhomboid family serine protease